MDVEEPGAVADTEMTNEKLFEKLRSGSTSNVYIKENGDWKQETVQHLHSKKLRFMVEGGTWYDVDVKTMTLEKPEGFVAMTRKRASSHGDISTIQSSGVSFSSRTTYGPTRIYRPRYTTPEKPSHGFAGLKNQGATCYLNSLLQTLYMTMELREALFKWQYNPELDGDDDSKCMTYQLQLLFARLQASRQGAATTSALTKSFGWSGAEVYQQHDVVELAQVLFDFMAEKAHDDNLKNVVTQFQCEISDYVECLEHGDKRERLQPLVGIPLPIEGKEVKTLHNAFNKYTECEILEGDNAVMNEVIGRKTKSKKGVAFTRFGQFLSIQLGRWTLNLRTFQREKIQKPIEFDLELDVAPFVNSDTPLKYELYSMMIHRGGAYGGHYYAYIKDFKTGKWFEFNDSTVTEIPDAEFEAMMDINNCNNDNRNYRTRTSPLVGAYMLMYRRVDADPMQEVSDEIIPAEMRDLITREDEKWVQKRTEFWLRIMHADQIEEVVFDRNETFGAQVDKVLKEFKLPNEVRREDIRFRAMNMGKKARAFENIDQSFSDIGIDDGDAIFMEIKKPDEDFEEVEVDWIILKVMGLDDANPVEPIQIGEIKVDKQGKTNQIRNQCANLLGVSSQECKIYCRYDRDGEADLDAMDYDNIDVEQVYRHLVEIWADKCANFEQEDTTPIYDIFEEKKHFIDLEFNKPGSFDFTEHIPLDDRKTIGEVREMIGKHLGIDPMSFIVGRKFDNELKDLNKELCRCYISQRRLFLREGKPLVDGEFRVSLWYDTEEEGEERFTPLHNHFVINKTWTLADFHENLMRLQEADGDSSQVPPLPLMRLRKKFREHMTEFVHEEGTMSNLGGLQDGFQIVIQRLKQPEKLKKTDLILRIIHWHPKTRTWDPEDHEIIISRKTKINEFCAKAIVPIVGEDIPLKHLQWAKVQNLNQSMDHIKWIDANDDDHRTLHKGFYKNGGIIFYRDGREVPEEDEEEDVRAAEVGSQGGSGRNWRAGGGAMSSRYRPKERGIKIFSVQEQEERSANRRKGSIDDEKMMEPYGPDRERGHSC